MTSLVSGRDRRALLLGASVVALGLIAARGVPAVVRWTIRERANAERGARLVDEARIATRSLAALRDSGAARRARAAGLDSLFLEGSTVSLSAANLASELSENAEVVDAQIAALQADSALDSPSIIRKVRARASIVGELDAIMQFLLLAESGPRLLVVREVSISLRDGQAGGRGTVHASVVIEGMVRPRSLDAGRAR